MATPNDAIEIKEEPMDDDDVVMVPSPSVTPNTTVKKEERVSEVIIWGHTKKKSVSGVEAGWLKKVRIETFFSKNGQYFHTTKPQKNYNKKIMRPLYWLQ